MKRFVNVAVILGALSVAGLAGTFQGTLIDTMCKGKDAVAHTRKCAIGCAKSGYGLITADGKFLKFDPAGNDKALTALKESKKDDDLKATVTGTMDGEVLTVESIQIQ